MPKKLTLIQWIDSIGGPQEAAKLLKVEDTAVYHWKHKRCLPAAKLLARIRVLSKGAVDCNEVIESYHNKSKKKA